MKTKHSTASLAITALLFAFCATTALAQTPTLPSSSISNAADAGQTAHTYLKILASSADFTATPQVTGSPYPGYLYQTPASIACVYNLQSQVAGCNPNVVSLNPSGGGRAIAIVDAFDNPNAYADLQTFSTQFGLSAITPSSFQVVFAPHGSGAPGSCATAAVTRPPTAKGTGWDLEEALDIEWAHAMAPSATLYLVEAQSNSFSDLFCAITVANKLVNAAGGGEVSMSWGSYEFPAETTLDSLFTTPNVVYFASTGDFPGVSYPSASPNVVSVGGTSLSFDPISGNFIGENTWQDTGGGTSSFEPRPSYQDGKEHVVGLHRGTPDIASNANPETGVWVFDSLASGRATWYAFGGTSVSSPTWAGIVNTAGRFSASSQNELSLLYSAPASDFTGIKVGNCGPYMSVFASGNWDFCSGLGSPRGYQGK
jgi:subtilase family serine protease